MKIKAEEFHPMRGHMEDGAVVIFQDGRTATLKHTVRGWTLVDQKGGRIFEPVESAWEVTAKIVQNNKVPTP